MKNITNSVKSENRPLYGIALSPSTVVSNANFCVGQNLSFSLSGLTNGTTATNFQWTLGGTFVNEFNQPCPDCSTNYTNDANLLTNAVITNCWWISGSNSPPAPYNATVTCTLLFTNGLAPQPYTNSGQFTMHRPEIYESHSVAPSAVITNGILKTNPRFFYGAFISSAFSGLAATTQLENGYKSNADFTVTTTNLWELDTLEFYPLTPSVVFVPVNAGASGQFSPPMNVTGLGDGPAAPCSGNTAMHLDFTDYVLFQPNVNGSTNVNGSIFVTLGIINWHIYATAALSNSTYVVTSTNGAADTQVTPSSTFPQWSNNIILNLSP